MMTEKDRNRRRKRKKQQQNRRISMLMLAIFAAVLVFILAVPSIGDVPEEEDASITADSSPGDVNDVSDSEVSDQEGENESSETEEASSEEEETEPVLHQATVSVVGDIMVHIDQLYEAYDASTDSFDFSYSFELITDELSEADLTVANLETTFGGIDTWTEDAYHGYTGYPCFNSPDILASNLVDAGIDFLGTANNHSLDSHADGIQRTLEVIREAGLDSTGTFSELDAPRYTIEEIDGISIAIMAYTYGANGFEMPEGEEGYFNSFVDYDEDLIEQMYEDVAEVAALDEVDLVAVMLHMGTEYSYEPTSTQEEVVDQLFASGADIVWGSHPHVLQPFEIREVTDDDGTTRQCFVIYSLGNFISSQYWVSSDPVHKDIGVILTMDFEKIDDEQTVITGLKLMPTYVLRTSEGRKVVPVESALYSYAYGTNNYGLTDSQYQLILSGQSFFQETFWPEAYTYSIEDGYYVVDLEG